MRREMRVLALALALLLPSVGGAEETESGPQPEEIRIHSSAPPAPRVTGSVSLEITAVSVGIGVSWGSGILTFQNENHPFRVRGLGMVGVGGNKVRATGTVFNLDRLEDFPGTWAEIDGAAVIGRSASGGISLSNGKVTMILSGERTGAKLSAGGGVVTIRWAEDEAAPE
jgi:outer membrane immunogenic protein